MWCESRITVLRKFRQINAREETGIRSLRIDGETLHFNEDEVEKILRMLQSDTGEYYKQLKENA